MSRCFAGPAEFTNDDSPDGGTFVNGPRRFPGFESGRISRVAHPEGLANAKWVRPISTGLNFRDKIIGWGDLPAWRSALRAKKQRLVVTNGCFDLLHAGHVTYLENARNLGDALLIGLNRDAAVRELKGPGRPVNNEDDRAVVLAALESVSGVCHFAERTATLFLERAQPDIYVKGGDYTVDTLPKEERDAVQRSGGQILIIPFLPGRSTTALLKKISAL